MSIINEELEDRYPIEEGDRITLTREQLALQLRRAYKAGATRDFTRTPHGHSELVNYRDDERRGLDVGVIPATLL